MCVCSVVADDSRAESFSRPLSSGILTTWPAAGQSQEPGFGQQRDVVSTFGFAIGIQELLTFGFGLPVRRLAADDEDVGRVADSGFHDGARFAREFFGLGARDGEFAGKDKVLAVQ